MIPKKAAAVIRGAFQAGTAVCLTGAGISVASGIPAFRGKGGLWEKYDPEVYGYPRGLTRLMQRHPRKLADFIADFYSVVCKAKPNPAHIGLAALERGNHLRAVITQNIDDLHQQAGSRRVIELHGNAFRLRCADCARTLAYEKPRLREMAVLLKKSKTGIDRILSRYFPRCACGGRLRLDVVLFSEPLSETVLEAASESLRVCSVLLIIGTSLNVYPAASLPAYAREHGATLIEINNAPSAPGGSCDFSISGNAGDIVPELVGLL